MIGMTLLQFAASQRAAEMQSQKSFLNQLNYFLVKINSRN